MKSIALKFYFIFDTEHSIQNYQISPIFVKSY